MITGVKDPSLSLLQYTFEFFLADPGKREKSVVATLI